MNNGWFCVAGIGNSVKHIIYESWLFFFCLHHAGILGAAPSFILSGPNMLWPPHMLGIDQPRMWDSCHMAFPTGRHFPHPQDFLNFGEWFGDETAIKKNLGTAHASLLLPCVFACDLRKMHLMTL